MAREPHPARPLEHFHCINMTEQNGASSDVIMNKREAAQYLRVVTRTLERLASSGRIKVYKPSFSIWRVRKSELDRFLESGASIAS
jgi:excisionase family DNA binding protein